MSAKSQVSALIVHGETIEIVRSGNADACGASRQQSLSRLFRGTRLPILCAPVGGSRADERLRDSCVRPDAQSRSPAPHARGRTRGLSLDEARGATACAI